MSTPPRDPDGGDSASFPELIAAEQPEDDIDDEAIGQEAASTTSLTSSVLDYRTIHGRTFHSERYNVQYFTPNDSQQAESIDINHHYLTLLLDGKLFLAPIKDDVQKVIDIGTGTGIWAIDFANEHPAAEVIGTDLSPMQPAWVPPNLKFEIDDATLPWTWPPNTFDFVHIRWLFGAISDWSGLFKEAFKCCKPGGWLESCELDVVVRSDDGTVETGSSWDVWNTLFREGGKKSGRSFAVLDERLQEQGMREAGFEDIHVKNFKLPVGGWAQNSKLAEIGQFVRLAVDNDLEGYTLFMWNSVLGWPAEEYQPFLLNMRKVMRNRRVHGYAMVRFVYGRKPEDST